MVKMLFLVIFTIQVISLAQSAEEELNSANFHAKINVPDQFSLVMYYASWCGHCKDTKPHFHRAAEAIAKKKDSKNKRFFTFNCEETGNLEVCSKESIEGYPTIKLYHGGVLVEEYFDENIEGSFINYMTKPPKVGEGKLQPRSDGLDSPLENVLNINAGNFSLIKDYKQALVFFYAPWCPHCTETKPKFSEAGKKFFDQKEKKTTIFFAMNCDPKENEGVCNDEKVDGFPTIRYYKNGEAWAEYEEEFSVEKFKTYFEKFAPSKKQKILTLKERFAETNDKQAPKENEKIDWKSIIQIKTNKDFEKSVKSSENDRGSLVMFYAPWCGHCQNYKPFFIKAGDAIEKEKSLSNEVSLFAIDCDNKDTETSCTDENITGYPTIVLYDNAGKKVKEMSSTIKEKSEIFDFIKKNLGLIKKEAAATSSSSMKDEL